MAATCSYCNQLDCFGTCIVDKTMASVDHERALDGPLGKTFDPGELREPQSEPWELAVAALEDPQNAGPDPIDQAMDAEIRGLTLAHSHD